jgi:hypothetical protein
VTYDDRPKIIAARMAPATRSRRPARLTFEKVFALRWKICGIGC